MNGTDDVDRVRRAARWRGRRARRALALAPLVLHGPGAFMMSATARWRRLRPSRKRSATFDVDLRREGAIHTWAWRERRPSWCRIQQAARDASSAPGGSSACATISISIAISGLFGHDESGRYCRPPSVEGVVEVLLGVKAAEWLPNLPGAAWRCTGPSSRLAGSRRDPDPRRRRPPAVLRPRAIVSMAIMCRRTARRSADAVRGYRAFLRRARIPGLGLADVPSSR